MNDNIKPTDTAPNCFVVYFPWLKVSVSVEEDELRVVLAKPTKSTRIRLFDSQGEVISHMERRIITTEETIKITAETQYSNSKPAPHDGEFTWTVETDGVVRAFPAGSSKEECVFEPVAVGVTRVKSEVDAKVGTGEQLIKEEFEIEVTAAMATKVALTYGTPQPLAQA